MSDKGKSKRNPIEVLRSLPGTLRPMGEVDPLDRPLWEIDSRFLDPFAPVPEVPTWANMGNRPALPKSGIITFSAKPKQGKSLSVYALLLPLLTGAKLDTLTPAKDRPRLVVVFDTEMDTATLAHRAATMRTALGEAAPRFQVVPMLEIPKSDRKKVIEEITKKYRPEIVAIDQIARLVANFNDAAENVEFGEWLAQFAAKRTVLTVIHQNKAADNTQMKGHLGSLMEELAVENYSVSQKNGIFEIKPVNARQSCVDDDSAAVTFALNESGEIVTATSVEEGNKEREIRKLHTCFELVFGANRELCYSDILRRLTEERGLKRTAAEEKLKAARQEKVIIKTDPANSRSPYRLMSSASLFADVEIDEEESEQTA